MGEAIPEDFESWSECDQKLTDEQIKAILNMTYLCLLWIKKQKVNLTTEIEEAFLYGAMCAFMACKSSEKLPVSWIFGVGSMVDRLNVWKEEGKLTEGA